MFTLACTHFYTHLCLKIINEAQIKKLCVFVHAYLFAFTIQVHILGLDELQVFVPCGLMDQRLIILQLLNAAAGKECSKEPDEIPEDEAYLLMSKHGVGDVTAEASWALWDGTVVKLVPQMETADTLKAMKVN